MDDNAKQIETQIENKKSSFFSVLDDFKKYYVYYNMNPEYDEYSNQYTNSKTQLQTLSSDVFQITSNIQRKIEDKNESMASISKKLDKEKQINQGLNEIAKSLHGVKAGSTVMINDSKTDYNLQYYKNIEIFLGILILLALIVSPKASLVIFIVFIILKSGIFQSSIPVLGHLF
jgi:hypothetical protein